MERARRAYLWMDSLLTFGRIAPSSFILCASSNLGSFVVSSVCPRARVLNPFPRAHFNATAAAAVAATRLVRFSFLFVGRGEEGGARSGAPRHILSLIMHEESLVLSLLGGCSLSSSFSFFFILFLLFFVEILRIKDRYRSFRIPRPFFFFSRIKIVKVFTRNKVAIRQAIINFGINCSTSCVRSFFFLLFFSPLFSVRIPSRRTPSASKQAASAGVERSGSEFGIRRSSLLSSWYLGRGA